MMLPLPRGDRLPKVNLQNLVAGNTEGMPVLSHSPVFAWPC